MSTDKTATEVLNEHLGWASDLKAAGSIIRAIEAGGFYITREPPASKLAWSCESCDKFIPVKMEDGEMVCACGYIIATYDRAVNTNPPVEKRMTDRTQSPVPSLTQSELDAAACAYVLQLCNTSKNHIQGIEGAVMAVLQMRATVEKPRGE